MPIMFMFIADNLVYLADMNANNRIDQQRNEKVRITSN
jgi:hypothetical protein